jgi:hypothetical protein
MEIYPGAPGRGATALDRDDVIPPSDYRLYRATVTAAFVLCPRDRGEPCRLHSIAADHRTPVAPWRHV